MLADNRLAELGDWNSEVLQLELDELSLLDLDFSLEVTGFSLPEIEAIRFGVGDADPGDDELPPTQETVVSQLGDVWRLGEHRLIVGSATDPAVLERLLAENRSGSVFTDPPYNVPVRGPRHFLKGARRVRPGLGRDERCRVHRLPDQGDAADATAR